MAKTKLKINKPVYLGLSILEKGEKPKTNFSKARMEKIRKEFNESRHKFSKSINEIRKNLYEIESEKNLFEGNK